MTRPTCKDCRYWYAEDDVMADLTTSLKECRRLPPVFSEDVITPDEPDRFGHWPVTFDDNWCGEHKPIQTAPGYSEYEEPQT